MAELKTKVTGESVDDYLAVIESDRRRDESRLIDAVARRITGHKPRMWGASIVGYGSYHYKYASGREGDWLATGFSPRKQALTKYVMLGFGNHDDLMAQLGKYKTGKSCLYINKLEDVDLGVLERLIERSFKDLRNRYPDETVRSAARFHHKNAKTQKTFDPPGS